ncbi:hypothetical protein ABXV22_26690, partial [Vibrio rotiferianus]|uniref:hypothetical protein n=1 Tax=Vibrio rotiferianus TaxID=190895 RepID=UPI003476243E
IVVFGAIRPAIKAAQPVPAPEEDATHKLSAIVDDPQELPMEGEAGFPQLEAPGADHKLEAARQLARDNPAAMANLMRGWMNN